MINEYTYTVGMIFISWVVAIFMAVGVNIIQSMRNDLKHKDLSDEKRLQLESFIHNFDSYSVVDKFVKVIYYGALSLMFTFEFLLKGRR